MKKVNDLQNNALEHAMGRGLEIIPLSVDEHGDIVTAFIALPQGGFILVDSMVSHESKDASISPWLLFDYYSEERLAGTYAYKTAVRRWRAGNNLA